MVEAVPQLWCTNLCISVADVLMPRHRSSITPATATQSKNLVLVRKVHIALVGGRLALATFQLMPPFGRSMIKRVGWPATPPRDGLAAVQLKPRSAQGMCRDVSACGRVEGRAGKSGAAKSGTLGERPSEIVTVARPGTWQSWKVQLVLWPRRAKLERRRDVDFGAQAHRLTGLWCRCR